jgi:hypothetical protein
MKKVAIIGSRKTPQTVCDALEEYAVELLTLGYHGVSGGAPGPDTALSNAIYRMSVDTGYPGAEFGTIWLPDHHFNGFAHGDLGGACRNAMLERTIRNEAARLARDIHGGWHNLTRFMRQLHARNVYQILGPELNEPVEFVLCSAYTTRSGVVKGGTATAVKIAKMHGVPVINLLDKDGFDEIDKKLIQLREAL